MLIAVFLNLKIYTFSSTMFSLIVLLTCPIFVHSFFTFLLLSVLFFLSNPNYPVPVTVMLAIYCYSVCLVLSSLSYWTSYFCLVVLSVFTF
jgi:hypothetical protein